MYTSIRTCIRGLAILQFSKKIVVIYQILYFSDTASIEEHLYIDVEKYLMLGRENGTKTCLRTTTTRVMINVGALTFEEIIVI